MGNIQTSAVCSLLFPPHRNTYWRSFRKKTVLKVRCFRNDCVLGWNLHPCFLHGNSGYTHFLLLSGLVSAFCSSFASHSWTLSLRQLRPRRVVAYGFAHGCTDVCHNCSSCAVDSVEHARNPEARLHP